METLASAVVVNAKQMISAVIYLRMNIAQPERDENRRAQFQSRVDAIRRIVVVLGGP